MAYEGDPMLACPIKPYNFAQSFAVKVTIV